MPESAATTAKPCKVCGDPIVPGTTCQTCGSKPSAISNLVAKLTAGLSGTTQAGEDARPPVLVALIAIASAAVALGFELGRFALEAVIGPDGHPILDPAGLPILREVGPNEGAVTFQVTAIAGGVYVLGDRLWRHLARRARIGREGLMLLFFACFTGVGVVGSQGCIAREVRADQSIEIKVYEPAPCRISVIVDGRLVHRTVGPMACPIQVEELKPPAPTSRAPHELAPATESRRLQAMHDQTYEDARSRAGPHLCEGDTSQAEACEPDGELE